VGYVPLENIIGRAGMIYFSVGPRCGRQWVKVSQRTDRLNRAVRMARVG